MSDAMHHDVIIIGAGTAGCVLAARLSQDRNRRVLLLEAGGPARHAAVRIPAAFSRLFRTRFDWAFQTEPQSALNGRRLYWPRGKMVGGSGAMNAMIYVRGHPADYDAWAAAGNAGWSFADVLPFFKLSEDQQRGPSAYHGAGGPLRVVDLRDPNPLSTAFVHAGIERGLPANGDFNGPSQEGVGFYQVTQRGGARLSTADAYLAPARRRPNLTVITGAHARRLLFRPDPNDGRPRAHGVVYSRAGTLYTAEAAEIILCAGAIQSPQLLLLSGIGPGGDLQALGINVVLDLPGVGRNLQDHLAAGIVYDCRQPISLTNAERPAAMVRFLASRRGPLTSNVAEAGAFVCLDPAAERPDVQFHFAPIFFIDHGFSRPTGHGFTLGPTLLRPRSRGWISLDAPDPEQAPRVQPNYGEDPADHEILLAGLKLARRLASARSFDPYRGDERLPGAIVRDDDGLRQHLRATAQTLYHPVGTCKMGPDRLAVVDEQLRVHGVAGLRVADASIMPQVTSGNTNAPTIMIAEKAAAMIRGDALPRFA